MLIDGFVINQVSTGGSFGERGLLRGETRSASVRTTTDTSFLCLDRDAFLSTVLSHRAPGGGSA